MLPMKSNKKVFRKRLYQQVADDVEVAILNGTYPHDCKLPSEQELADEYGVSRNVIREALKRLNERGLVFIKTGSGTYVRQPSTKPVSDALHRLLIYSNNSVSIAHFYEIRRMIEPEVARLAALHATEDDLKAIQSAYDRMDKNRDNREAWTQADLQFHLAIAGATKNPLIQSILNPLNEPLLKVIEAGLEEPSGVDAGLSAHREIISAIEDHDPERASQAMLDHLIDSEERVSLVGYELQSTE
jgi:GntR family transcriptional repressor for pyruvate dehydrogenase complex